MLISNRFKNLIDMKMYTKMLSVIVIFLFIIILSIHNFVKKIQDVKPFIYYNDKKIYLKDHKDKMYGKYYYFKNVEYDKPLILRTGDLLIIKNIKTFLKRKWIRNIKNIDSILPYMNSSISLPAHMCTIINLNIAELGDKMDNKDNIYIYDFYGGKPNFFKLVTFLKSHRSLDEITLLKLEKNNREHEIALVKHAYDQIENPRNFYGHVYHMNFVRFFINSLDKNFGGVKKIIYDRIFKPIDGKVHSTETTCVNAIAELYHNAGILKIKNTEYRLWSGVDFIYNKLPFTNDNDFRYYSFPINKFIQ